MSAQETTTPIPQFMPTEVWAYLRTVFSPNPPDDLLRLDLLPADAPPHLGGFRQLA